ncbi:glycosyltransferase [Pontibacter diazotrophicus]|uniref:Glycosyltransferase n=1 Tax=Pontibacter diazotrophicus TaxID=1400979 RepID=A0A3D8KZL2_9BACT|nr:glycosyltransferase [Pontibacter diazotrophicus]RDV10664.1 glycosyltransferase [Pontibacter diazotrophicus]
MKKKVLILSSSQFGYLTDTLKYCEHASDEFDFTYIGWDYNRKKIYLPYTNVKYVSRKSNKIFRNIKLLYTFHKEIGKGYDITFINYTRGVSLVKMFNPNEKVILDIRTLCVNPSTLKRFFYDLVLRLESIFFNNITVISEGIAKKLWLKDYHILPLGGEYFSHKSKCYENLSLLYVGTLQNRNIIDCVKGFHLFLKEHQHSEPEPLFTIIGDSPDYELDEIKSYVHSNKLEKNINIIGRIPQSELSPFFEMANVGVSYIPMSPHFNHQPPTKTYEYLISGLPVIATATHANKKIMNEEMGTFIEDNAMSFLTGMKKIFEQRESYDSEHIRHLYAPFSWNNIVKKQFVPMIGKLISSSN